MMRVRRVAATDEDLLEIDQICWMGPDAHVIVLTPAPVALVAGVSSQIALSRGHGKVQRISTRMAHNGATLSIRLEWEDPTRDDRIQDLDRFVDAAAVMFPLHEDANPFTMGDEGRPVNAWLWKADRDEPFDVIARGYSTSERRPGRNSGLVARGAHRNGAWTVVFQRPIQPGGGEFARFEPGGPMRVSFAVWEGSNAERAGQKAVSGAFLDAKLDR